MDIRLSLLAALLVGATSEPQITGRSPYWLGTGGGVTLYISGKDFSEDQFNHFDPTLGNRVVLVNEEDSIECDVINYLTTTEVIVCKSGRRTNMGASAVYLVKVFVDGQEASGYASVQYADWASPKIQRVEPTWALPGAFVRFYGWLHTNTFFRIDTNDPTAKDPTKGRVLTKVFVGGKDCEMINATTDELYVPLTYSQLYCRVTSKNIGPMNSSVYVTDRGASITDRYMMYVDSKDRLFQHHTYAGVESVNQASSSSGGGALITITGVGFNPNPASTQVQVGGAACEVQKVTDETITCLTPPQVDTAPGSGERGLLFELWEGVYFSHLGNADLWENLNSSHPNYTSSVILETNFDISLESPSTGRFRGYIHAPHDGVYSIGAHLGSASLFYIATNGNPNDKEHIAHWAEFTMRADTPTYLEILFHATESTKLRFMMNDLDAKFVSSQTFQAANEMQQVKMYPKVRLETQRFTLQGDPGLAKLFLNGFTSAEVNVSDTEQVRQGVLALTEQLCEVQGEDPEFALTTGYEIGEEEPSGSQGVTVDDIEPFCGRRVKQVRRTLPWLYYEGDTNKMIDLRKFPYVCMALRGNIEPSMDVRFYWLDRWNRNRDNTIYFDHNIISTSTAWSYQCLDLREVVANSWMKDQYQEGNTLLLKYFRTPKPASAFDEVYCDEFTVVDENINVVQMRPSALKAGGIMLADVEVVSVEGEETNAFDVSFITSNCAGDFPLLGVFTDAVNASWVEELSSASSANFSVNEGQVVVERTQAATHPLGGTWDLLIQGKTISGIPALVGRREMALMVESGLGRGGVKVTWSGSCKKRVWYFEWLEDPGRKELLSVDFSGLVFDGDDIYTETQRIRDAKIWHDGLSVDFLTTWREEPHVVVTVNGYTAACLGDCFFTYDDTDAPFLSSVSGIVDETDIHTITVTGTGFTSTNKSDYTVTVGGKDCSIMDVTTTQVTCNISLWAGNHLVTVAMQPVGAALPYPPELTYNVPLIVTSVTPSTGGTGGGYSMEVAGKGFPDPSGWASNSTVTLGGVKCQVTGAGNTGAATSVICTVPPGAAGSVDVTVSVGSTSATLAGGFTYDASLSASVTSVSPATSSVLGGEITVSGSGFGSGTDGYVKVGSSACEIVTWDDLTIVCTLPALLPGHYPVIVYTGAQGFASGNASVTYNLKITASSLSRGSISGGTILVLQGEGFGSNCSLLEVDLGGGMRCQVTRCSDVEVACLTQLVPINHVLTNLGIHSTFGLGYAWKPRLVTVREGDSVTWSWSKKDSFSQLKHNVFQTRSSADFVYDGTGFHSGTPTSAGSMTVEFPNSGSFYFAGDLVAKDLVMSGQINVVKPPQESYKVTLSLGGIEAEYDPSGDSVNVTVEGCDPVLEDPLAGCNSTAPYPPDIHHVYHITDTCFTPIIYSINASDSQSVPGLSGLQVRVGTTLTIEGSGFGSSPCQTSVRVGSASCSVTASANDTITCILDDAENLLSVRPYPVTITIANRGNAVTEIPSFKDKGLVTVVPVMTSFDPAQGSVAGGTIITITGTGLEAYNGQATVMLGAGTCQVVSVAPTNLTCSTSPTSPSNVTLTLFVGGVEAVNEVSDLIFMFSEAATPTVNNISISGQTLSIAGSSFGSEASQITVTLIPTSVRHKRSTGEEVVRLEKEMVPVEEDMAVDDEIGGYDEEAEEPRSMHHPRVHSDLFDKFDAVSAFWGQFTRTNAKTFSDTRKLGAWRVGGTNPTSMSYEDVEEIPRVKREVQDTPYSYGCTPSVVSDTSIVCEAVGLPAGSYFTIINIKSLGDAAADEGFKTVTAAAIITDMTPTEGSVNGGALLTLSGSGFTPGDVSVTLDGAECQLVSENTTTLTCHTPAHAVGIVAVVVTSGGASTNSPYDFTYDLTKTPVLSSVLPATSVTGGMALTLSGTNLRLSGSDQEVLVGGASCALTAATNTELICTSPDLAAGTYPVVVRDLSYGDSNIDLSVTYDLTLNSVSPTTGGYGGAEVTISGAGFDPAGGSTVTLCGDLCRPVTSNSTSLICIAPVMEQGSESTLLCDVTVTNPDRLNVTLAEGFTYDISITSKVVSVSPVRGGSAGGTTLTITGTGFAASGNTVSIGGSECVVTTEDTTKITCTTEAHKGPGSFPVLVTVPAAGIATTNDSGVFFYIDRWSSIYTWGGEPVPSEGQLVVIEEGQTILLDDSTEVLKMLLIKGGHVVVDPEAQSEIILRAEYILIVDGGSLSIGSEEEPYMGKAVIELHGNSRSIELPNYGAKVLAVRNGSLELHGTPVPVTWTHLASTASPGDTSITLKVPVTWQPGDQIVIATTEHKFMNNENEVRTIASVSGDGLSLTLTEALEYEHLSLQQNLGGRTVETRAEVGLLTRNVKVRGAINSDFTETIEPCGEKWIPGQFATQSCFNGRFGEEIGSDQFGATVMLSGKHPDEDLVQGRIQYVEVTEAGQAFQLGRYPLHFHLVGNVNTSYIRGCAVHRTYNRAVTIHAANYLTVEHNVVYNNMGHAIFTEDGVEQHNVIQYNLAVYTRTSSSLLNVDVTPSSFWVVNPNNIVRHNAAAGGTHFGYWYRIERHPSGPSYTTSYCQNNAPMGEFRNNTAHSMGRYGLWVFSMDGYHPKKHNCWGNDQVAVWNDFTVWRCDRGAEIVLGGALQFHNFVALDNGHAGLEMVKVKGGFGMDDGPGIFNSLVIGHSALTPGGCVAASGIVAPKQYIFSIANTTFVNFDNGQCAALSGCSQCKDFQGGYRVQVMGLTFLNAPNKLKFKWEHETIWIDADGSLSGAAENNVVPSMGILPSDTCQMDVRAFSVNPEVPGAVCSDAFRFLRFNIMGPNIEPSSLQGNDLIVTSPYGSTNVPYRKKRLTTEGWMGILYTGGTFNWTFDYSSHITNISYTAETRFVDHNDYYFVQHQLMQRPDGFSTTDDDRNSTDSLPDPMTNIHGDFYWDNDTRIITYLVSKKLSVRRRRSVVFDDRNFGSYRKIEFRVHRCQYEGCIPPTQPPVPTGRPDTTFRWSDVETWKEVPVGSGGHPSEDVYNLPVEGDKIIIPQGMWLIVDTATPPLARVYVYGVLEFEDTMDHIFNTTILYIQGGTVVAGFSENSPFTHNLNIVLRGSLDPNDPDNEDMPMPYGIPNVGWKAIGVFGQLTLHGQLSGRSWVKLGVTASPGDSQVTLTQPADPSWLNKQVLVTTTGKEASESEVRTVTAMEGATLTLHAPLTYHHLGVTHTLSNNSTTFSLAAEVGLLTRNIVVQGNEYLALQDDSFGGRIIVSQFNQNGIDYVGQAQLHSVELRNMGQIGFTDTDDPRYSLAFHGLGINDGSNYVRKCSFNKNYNVALGFFGSSNITVESNVIYHTVGSCIRDDSEDNTFRDNLLSVMLFPGSYSGREEDQNFDWFGGFDLNKALRTVLEDNVVAGSEQAGFRTYGEYCEDTTRWHNNEVHSATYGVLLWRKGGEGPPDECRRLNSFFAWRVWDTAFYVQHYSSFLLTDVMAVDCKLGVNQLVYSPPALSHRSHHKTATVENSVFVGASPSYTCTYHNSKSNFQVFYHEVFWEGGLDGGNTAIIFASFTSTVNMAPKHKFNEASSYPALYGASYITGVTFANYDSRSCGRDQALLTNKDSDDGIHPIFVKDIIFLDTPQANYLFIHRANLNRVNPSDCVDMDCDGLKKVLIQDMDGSLLGSVNATVTSEAEHEWDGDRSHGIGDYRIPVALKQNLDGSQIPAKDKFPNKGIVRDDSCNLMPTWQAWKCTNLQHRMLVIESLDSDTEIRRLSPIALIANPGVKGYVDLLNGPMDRGWCMGYTCQERISTFYSIVAVDYIYEMAMTGTPPQHLRFHLLHSDPSEAVVVRLFFPKTQRYDVYVDDTYMPPTNIDITKYPPVYQLIPEDPSNPKAFFPMLSQEAGTNYLQRKEKFLHVVLRGGHVIDIKTTPLIVLTTGIVVDPDNIFEENVVQNMADLLGVSPENIRVTNIIREDSTRRRRRSSTETVQFEFEIASVPTASTEGNSSVVDGVTGDVLTYDDLEESLARIVNIYQRDGCSGCNLTFTSVEVVDPVKPPEVPDGKASEDFGSQIIEDGELFSNVQQQKEQEALNKSLGSTYYGQPAYSTLEQGIPAVVTSFTVFTSQPYISVQDSNGSTITMLGHSSDPWMVTATLWGGPVGATLLGTNPVLYLEGAANFTDLSVDMPGEDYNLTFSVTHPNTAPQLTVSLDTTFRALEKKVLLKMSVATDFMLANQNFTIRLDLLDDDTGEPINPTQMLGQTMQGGLALKSNYNQKCHLSSNTKFTVTDGNVSSFTLEELSIGQPGVAYQIIADASVQPAGWKLDASLDELIVYPAYLVIPEEPITWKVNMKVKRGKKKVLIGNESLFENLLLKKLLMNVGRAFWGKVSLRTGHRPKAFLTVRGSQEQLIDAMDSLCLMMKQRRLRVRIMRQSFIMKRLKINGKRIRKCNIKRSRSNVFLDVRQLVNM